MTWLFAVAAIAAGYAIGSINFSYLYGKWFRGIDIRNHGSGNAGATNTLRVLGKGPAIGVLALDVAKGVAAVWIGRWIAVDSAEVLLISILAGLAAIIGHNWPVFFSFKGGKGIATTIGVVATLCFLPALYAGLIGIASIVITRYVSLGSILFTVLLPFSLLLTGREYELIVASALIAVFAVVRHRSNIRKLLRGQENKLGSRSPSTGGKST